MRISFTLVLVLIIGYILARFFPQPGNLIGLPG